MIRTRPRGVLRSIGHLHLHHAGSHLLHDWRKTPEGLPVTRNRFIGKLDPGGGRRRVTPGMAPRNDSQQRAGQECSASGDEPWSPKTVRSNWTADVLLFHNMIHFHCLFPDLDDWAIHTSSVTTSATSKMQSIGVAWARPALPALTCGRRWFWADPLPCAAGVSTIVRRSPSLCIVVLIVHFLWLNACLQRISPQSPDQEMAGRLQMCKIGKGRVPKCAVTDADEVRRNTQHADARRARPKSHGPGTTRGREPRSGWPGLRFRRGIPHRRHIKKSNVLRGGGKARSRRHH